MKKITQGNFLYIYFPVRNRKGSKNFFFEGRVRLEKQLKVNKGGGGGGGGGGGLQQTLRSKM